VQNFLSENSAYVLSMDRKQKFYLSLGVILIIAAAMVFCVIFPLLGKIGAASRDYLEGEKTIALLEREIVEVKNMEKAHQEIKKTFSELQTAFLDSEETLGFITSLERLAATTQNTIEIRGVSTSPLGDFINFQISITGSPSNLIYFLTAIENTPYPPYRLVEIENIGISKSTQDSSIQTNLEIKVYTKQFYCIGISKIPIQASTNFAQN